MKTFVTFVRLVAPIFLLVGLLHLALGLGTEARLGARVPIEALSDPTLDSQNRFYGVSFTLYGVLIFLCASDLRRYGTVLRCVLWVLFCAGLARIVSIATHGMPALLAVALLAAEVIVPPLIVWWLSKIETQFPPVPTTCARACGPD